MSDENIPDESKPIRKRSSGFINKISRWIPESWTGRIVAGTLIASIAFGGYSLNKCSKSDINDTVKQTFVQKTKDLVSPNTVKECAAYFQFNDSKNITNKDNFEKCLDTLPKDNEYLIIGSSSIEGSKKYNYALGESRANSQALEDILKENNVTIVERKSIGEQTHYDPTGGYGPGSNNKNRATIIMPVAGKEYYNANPVDNISINPNINTAAEKHPSSPFNQIIKETRVIEKIKVVDKINCGDNSNCTGKGDIHADTYTNTTGEKIIIPGSTIIPPYSPLPPGPLDPPPLPPLRNYNPLTCAVNEGEPIECAIPTGYKVLHPNFKITVDVYDGDVNNRVGGKKIDLLEDVVIGNTIHLKSAEIFPLDNNEDDAFDYRFNIDENNDGIPEIIEDGNQPIPNLVPEPIKSDNIINNNKIGPSLEKKDDHPRNPGAEKQTEKSCEENPAYCKNQKPTEVDPYQLPQNEHMQPGIYIGKGIGFPADILSQMIIGAYADGIEMASLDVGTNTLAYKAKPKKSVVPPETVCTKNNFNLSWERDGWVNKKGNFDNTNEISGKPGTYVIKADEKVDYKVVDNTGKEIPSYTKGNDIIFDMLKDVQSVKVSTVYKENEKDCAKKDLVIKNKKFKPGVTPPDCVGEKCTPPGPKGFREKIKKAAEKTGVFAGITTGTYEETYKNDSTDISYKGDTQTIGAGIPIKADKNVTITPYATQTEIKADVIDTATGDDFAKVKFENLTVGLNTEFKVGKKNSPLEDTKIELEADYTKTDSSVDYTNFDIHAKKTQDGFIGIGDVEMPKLFHVTNNVDMGLGFRAVYSQEDGKMIDDSPAPDNVSFKLTRGLYGGKLLFNIDMDKFYIPDSASFAINYRSIDDTQSDETLKGMGLRNTLYFKHGKTYAELFGEFPINGDLKLTDYGAILGWDKLANKGPLSYLGFEFQGGVRNLEKITSIDKDIAEETYFTGGIKINTDKALKLLKDPFNR